MVNWPTAQQHHRIECFVYRSCPLEVRIIIVKWRRWKGRNSSVRRGWMLFSWQRLSPTTTTTTTTRSVHPSVPVEQTVESNSNLLLSLPPSLPASVKLQSQTQTLTIQFSSGVLLRFDAAACCSPLKTNWLTPPRRRRKFWTVIRKHFDLWTIFTRYIHGCEREYWYSACVCGHWLAIFIVSNGEWSQEQKKIIHLSAPVASSPPRSLPPPPPPPLHISQFACSTTALHCTALRRPCSEAVQWAMIFIFYSFSMINYRRLKNPHRLFLLFTGDDPPQQQQSMSENKRKCCALHEHTQRRWWPFWLGAVAACIFSFFLL